MLTEGLKKVRGLTSISPHRVTTYIVIFRTRLASIRKIPRKQERRQPEIQSSTSSPTGYREPQRSLRLAVEVLISFLNLTNQKRMQLEPPWKMLKT